MRDESLDAIEKKFNVKRTKILSYFHYQPTFYHLHVHFVHVDKVNTVTRECVSLDQVITNIEMMSDYYQRATLSYKLGTQMPLFKILVEKGILEPEPIEEVKEEAQVEAEETKQASGKPQDTEDAKEDKGGSIAAETPG